MRLTRIIWQHLRGDKARAIFLLLGIVLGIGHFIALGGLARQLEVDASRQQAFHVVRVAPEQQELSLAYRGITVAAVAVQPVREMPPDIMETIASVVSAYPPGSVVVAPKLVGQALGVGRTWPVVGMDFTREVELKPYWQVEGSYAGPGEVLVGAAVPAGSRMEMAGRTWRVSGVLAETGQVEDQLVFLPLDAAREVLDQPDGVSFVELLLRAEAVRDEEKLVANLNRLLPSGVQAVAVQTAARERQETAARFAVLARFISWVLLVAGALIVYTTQMGSVRRRKREIGVLRAIGYRQRHVLAIVLGEIMAVALAGGLLGYLAGLALQATLAPVVLGTAVPPAAGIDMAGRAMGLALVSGLLAGFYPAWRAARLDPLEALR